MADPPPPPHPSLPDPDPDTLPPIDNIHALAPSPPPPSMMDHPFPPETAASPAPTTTNARSTPSRPVNGAAAAETAPPPLPAKAASHGAPARRYLNEKVTGVLLEGVRRVAAEQPEDPLRVLGEFLLQRSREIEGGGGV